MKRFLLGAVNVALGEAPEVGVFKTVVTRAGEIEAFCHLKTDIKVSTDFVVGLRIKIEDRIEGAAVVIHKGVDITKAFPFEDGVQWIQIMEHRDFLNFKLTDVDINMTEGEYLAYRRPYKVSENNRVSISEQVR